ncbi:hypothetical protein C5746_42965 [Streptomyces atratus]|uniref:Uncharacterized protein n=1 Tax=Streptomyces atratus TaxID=1893 RepID=A0A2Z5J5X0_STRAR|nr:hypothetical protein C5746_00270 [Streptomyces atratus]AXE82476.1 hypothetical protein C5746_42965 [Streptomyces atratus]
MVTCTKRGAVPRGAQQQAQPKAATDAATSGATPVATSVLLVRGRLVSHATRTEQPYGQAQQLVADGRLEPTLTARGYEAWKIAAPGPWQEQIDALLAAMPPEAHAGS